VTENTGFFEPAPAPAEPVAEVQPEPEAKPDWLTEVENNAPVIVATAIGELFKLIKG